MQGNECGCACPQLSLLLGPCLVALVCMCGRLCSQPARLRPIRPAVQECMGAGVLHPTGAAQRTQLLPSMLLLLLPRRCEVLVRYDVGYDNEGHLLAVDIVATTQVGAQSSEA